jgi:polyisoprenoid-binding protein YceI
MLPLLVSLSLLVLPAAGPAPAASPVPLAATWTIDPVHSDISFRIRHFVSKVRGTFTDWDGTITGDPADWSTGSVEVYIRTASVSTRNDRRDNDLRSARFFAADSFPEITFRSIRVEVTGSDISITGDLTMRGVTRSVVLKGEYLGLAPGKDGADKIGFEAAVTINRQDYGVSYNRVVEGGGTLLGDDVEITLAIEATRKIAQ